jgi:spermidine synthase
MLYSLCLIFFLSGASALIFEGLWLNLAGLTFGNSVWATSIVLSSFMAGLALGGALIAQQGYKVRNPIWLYSMTEAIIGVSGLLLVLFFPGLTALLAPLFKISSGQPLFVNFFRSLISFLLLIVPTTAMGATLPILVKAVYSQNQDFGRALGLLYGWNTLGAMIGVVLNELLLIRYFGIKGAGALAAILNLSAAYLALKLSKRPILEDTTSSPQKLRLTGLPLSVWRLLFACSLSGLIMLSLEVIWFRFMILFFIPHSWNFAIMLAVVLGGISLGGLTASRLSLRNPAAYRSLPYLFLVSGILLVILYGFFGWILAGIEDIPEGMRITFLSTFFLFPVSFVSGITFTFLGKALHIELGSETQASGLLALFNTAGGMIGAFLAGFALIPSLGVEKSFFILAIGYGFTGIMVMKWKGGRVNSKYQAISVGLLLIALAAFPFGKMQKVYLDLSLNPNMRKSAEKRIAYREGVTETIQYFRQDFFGEPDYYRLVTNSYSMAGTNLYSRRYMKLFAYLPIALNQDIKNSLLLCYGCGSTAKALTDTKSIKRIDVVDISKDVIDMSKNIYPVPNENPINDPRMVVHIEDGRFYLQTTDIEYDLITAEPPPPKTNGIVNLYTQEFFQLIHDRLSPGGIASYWLPVYQMKTSETKSIVRAFYNVFPNASLWDGSGFEWIMMGIKEPVKQASETSLFKQWNDPIVSKELADLGLINADQLGALFIADGNRLEKWISDDLPLDDNNPRRLSYYDRDRKKYLDDYRNFSDSKACAANFITSPLQKFLWPEKERNKILHYFRTIGVVNELLMPPDMRKLNLLYALDQCIHQPDLKEYILWVFSSDRRAMNIIEEKQKTDEEKLLADPVDYYNHLAAIAAYRGDFDLSEKYLECVEKKIGHRKNEDMQLFCTVFRMYFLYLRGKDVEANAIALKYIHAQDDGSADRSKLMEQYQKWITSKLLAVYK